MRFLSLFILFATASAPASYRVYQLKVTQYDAFGIARSSRIVLSTLDPFQYEDYHGGYRSSKVQLQDTWYCPGDTSYHAYCDKPKEPERSPASLEHPERYPLPISRQPVIP